VLVCTHLSQAHFQYRQYRLCPLSGTFSPWFLQRAQLGAVRGLKVLEALRLLSLAGELGLEAVNAMGQDDMLSRSSWPKALLIMPRALRNYERAHHRLKSRARQRGRRGFGDSHGCSGGARRCGFGAIQIFS